MTDINKTSCGVDWIYGLFRFNDAVQCKKQLEEQTKQPHHVEGFMDVSVGMSPVVKYRIRSGHVPGCQPDAVFHDSELPKIITAEITNEGKAQQCAESLTRLTGKNHRAEPVANSSLFSSTWKVILENSEK